MSLMDLSDSKIHAPFMGINAMHIVGKTIPHSDTVFSVVFYEFIEPESRIRTPRNDTTKMTTSNRLSTTLYSQ